MKQPTQASEGSAHLSDHLLPDKCKAQRGNRSSSTGASRGRLALWGRCRRLTGPCLTCTHRDAQPPNHRAQQAEQHADYRSHPESTTTLLVRLGEHCKQQGTLHRASAHLQTRQNSRQVHCHAPAAALLHPSGQHQRLLLTATADFTALTLRRNLPPCTCWNGTTSLRPQAAVTYYHQPVPHPRHRSHRCLQAPVRSWLAGLPGAAPLDLHLANGC